MRRPQRITLVISSLGAGGAERVASRLANHWAEQGRVVTVLTFQAGDTPPFFPLDSRVTVINLALARVSSTIPRTAVTTVRRVALLRKAIRQSAPHAIVSFLDTTNVLVLIATRGMGTPVLVAERSTLTNLETRRLTQALRAVVYRTADKIAVQTECARHELTTRLRGRAVVIPNPVAPPAAAWSRAEDPGGSARFISVGRQVFAKGYDLLLVAFRDVLRQEPAASLTLVGDGPERSALEALALRTGLGPHVRFVGQVPDPAPFFARADVFVLSSRYEGFPNALCEAMAHGLPAIAFDCRCGPSDIVRHGIDGLLVPPGDVSALAAAMLELTKDAVTQAHMGRHARDVAQRFSEIRVMALWDGVLESLTTPISC